MRSMTGYAYLEECVNDVLMSFELKSVNARFSDIDIQLPTDLQFFLPRTREFFLSSDFRGKLELRVRIIETNKQYTVHANAKLASQYYEQIQLLCAESNLPNTIDTAFILNLPSVLEIQKIQITVDWESDFLPVLQKVLFLFNESKKKEGAVLKADIRALLKIIEDAVLQIKQHSSELEADLKNRFTQKFDELFNEPYEPARILSEVGVLLMRYTINEELVRLSAHIESMYAEIHADKAVGKKLDFIAQEMNREINTIASKNQLIAVDSIIIEIKQAIENIREQVRNVE